MEKEPPLSEREWRYVKKYKPISFVSRYGFVEQYLKKRKRIQS